MRSKAFNSSAMSRFRIVMLLGICLQLALSAMACDPKREFTKTINREFGTTSTGMTALYNKYGKVNVNTWQNNSVKIEINIVVNASDQSKADRMFDRIQVNFTNTSGYIKAETMIQQGNGWWPSESACQDFKINYDVWIPIGNQLDLKNKYGNSFVSMLNGKLIAEIKYGDLRTETVNADVDLNIGYGKATLAKLNNLYGQVSYGGLAIGDARDIQIETNYSDLNLDKAGTLRATSKYDNYILGNLTELRLQTKYTDLKMQAVKSIYVTAAYADLKFGTISEVVDVDLTYGSMKVESLSRNFTSANINAKYTDVQLSTERGTAFRFDAQGSYTGFKYPAAATIRRRDDSGSRESVEGYVGDANAKSMVKARLNYGGFVLK
jgi:hypothetical protein